MSDLAFFHSFILFIALKKAGRQLYILMFVTLYLYDCGREADRSEDLLAGPLCLASLHDEFVSLGIKKSDQFIELVTYRSR